MVFLEVVLEFKELKVAPAAESEWFSWYDICGIMGRPWGFIVDSNDCALPIRFAVIAFVFSKNMM